MPHYESRYEFPSALTKVDEETGEFNEDTFKQSIKPLRGRIMSLDGVSGCYITRYGVMVKHSPVVAGSDVVDPHVQRCFDWAAENGFFPYLESGTKPAVTRVTGHIAQQTLVAPPPVGVQCDVRDLLIDARETLAPQTGDQICPAALRVVLFDLIQAVERLVRV